MNSHIIQSSSSILNNNITNNNGKIQTSFIDETRNVVMKHKLTKKNNSLNIKQSRLRKPLQNDKFLLNYFEFNSEQQQSNNLSSCSTLNNLTMYKIITINNNRNDDSSNNIPNEEINKIGKFKNGRRRLSMDTIITKKQVKVQSPLIDYNSIISSIDNNDTDDELFCNNYNKLNDDDNFKQEQLDNQYDNNYWDLCILELEQDLIDNSGH